MLQQHWIYFLFLNKEKNDTSVISTIYKWLLYTVSICHYAHMKKYDKVQWE